MMRYHIIASKLVRASTLDMQIICHVVQVAAECGPGHDASHRWSSSTGCAQCRGGGARGWGIAAVQLACRAGGGGDGCGGEWELRQATADAACAATLAAQTAGGHADDGLVVLEERQQVAAHSAVGSATGAGAAQAVGKLRVMAMIPLCTTCALEVELCTPVCAERCGGMSGEGPGVAAPLLAAA